MISLTIDRLYNTGGYAVLVPNSYNNISMLFALNFAFNGQVVVLSFNESTLISSFPVTRPPSLLFRSSDNLERKTWKQHEQSVAKIIIDVMRFLVFWFYYFSLLFNASISVDDVVFMALYGFGCFFLNTK